MHLPGVWIHVCYGWLGSQQDGHMLLELLMKVSCTQWQPSVHAQGQLHVDPSGLACLQPCEAWPHRVFPDRSSAPWQTFGLTHGEHGSRYKGKETRGWQQRGLELLADVLSSLNNEA